MDEWRRSFERRERTDDVSFIEWLNKVARWQSGNSLDKPYLSTTQDSSLLYLLAPLEFASCTYRGTPENVENLRNYYQGLINYIAQFPGTIIALAHPTWTSEALRPNHRDPQLTTLSTEMHQFLLNSSQVFPTKLIYGLEYNVRSALKSDLVTKIKDEQQISCFDPILDGQKHDVYFSADRLDRITAFVRDFIRTVDGLDDGYNLEDVVGVKPFIVLPYCYGNVPTHTEYFSCSAPGTHRTSQIRGWATGADPIMPIAQFVQAIQNESGATVVQRASPPQQRLF